MPAHGFWGQSVFVVVIVVLLGCFSLFGDKRASSKPRYGSFCGSCFIIYREGQSSCQVVKILVVFTSCIYFLSLVYLFIHQTQLFICRLLTFCQWLGCKRKLDNFPDLKDTVWLGRLTRKPTLAIKDGQHHI